MENSKDVYAHNCHAGASALCMKQRMFIHTKKSYERKNRQGGIEMQFDFDRITDRRNTGSLKWDAAEAELPMWVADMDFRRLRLCWMRFGIKYRAVYLAIP